MTAAKPWLMKTRADCDVAILVTGETAIKLALSSELRHLCLCPVGTARVRN